MIDGCCRAKLDFDFKIKKKIELGKLLLVNCFFVVSHIIKIIFISSFTNVPK